MSESKLSYYQRNKDKIKKRVNEYYHANRDKLRNKMRLE